MRVLHIVNDAETGGAQTLIEQLMLARPEGDDAHLLVLMGPGALSPRLEAAATSTTYVGMTRRDVVPLRAVRALRRLVAEHGIQVVHSHLQQSDLVNEITPHGARRVATLHNSLHLAQKPVTRVTWWLAAQASARLDAVVACSNSALGFAAESRYRFGTERIRIVHNGTRISPVPAPEPSGPPVFVHLGRCVEQKDHPTLFRAFARVLAEHPDARLFCAGHLVDPTNEALTTELETLGIGHAVTLLGSVSDVHALIRTAHAVVFASNHEALPMAGLEALSEGVPVITTDTGDAKLLAVDPQAVVPVRDPEALGRAMTHFVDLPAAERGEWRRRSWELGRTEFDSRGTARRYRELYEELTDGS